MIILVLLVANPIVRTWTKYVGVDYYFFREEVVPKDLIVQPIASEDQIVNNFYLITTDRLFQQTNDQAQRLLYVLGPEQA